MALGTTSILLSVQFKGFAAHCKIMSTTKTKEFFPEERNQYGNY